VIDLRDDVLLTEFVEVNVLAHGRDEARIVIELRIVLSLRLFLSAALGHFLRRSDLSASDRFALVGRVEAAPDDPVP